MRRRLLAVLDASRLDRRTPRAHAAAVVRLPPTTEIFVLVLFKNINRQKDPVNIHCESKTGTFITARRSYARAVLGVVILSVRPSVRSSVRPSVRPSHACFMTNPKHLPATFLYHMKGQSF